MCKTTQCETNGCISDWVCYCDYSCFTCHFGSLPENRGWLGPESESYKDVRNKYVCFPCKRIWKSSVSKYQRNNFTDYIHLKRAHSKHSEVSIEEQKRKRPDYFDSKYNDFCNAYDKKHSKCSKCSKDGILVGRNFRHCKTNKEWKILETNVANGKVDLVDDFHDYPKDLITSLVI